MLTIEELGNEIARILGRLENLESQLAPASNSVPRPTGREIPVQLDNAEFKSMLAHQQTQIEGLRGEVNYLMNKLNNHVDIPKGYNMRLASPSVAKVVPL